MVTIGIDEVGRGCWAGPLVAGAVILPTEYISGNDLTIVPAHRRSLLHPETVGSVELRDSKKLSKKKRELAAAWVYEHALATGIGWVSPAEVDSIGLTESVRLAMTRAVVEITISYDEIIIDGNVNYFAGDPRARSLVKADDSIPAVSAASIIAKVARDAYMASIDEQYAGYGFASHVGYGTAAHVAALQELGVCDIHRRSYAPIRALLQ